MKKKKYPKPEAYPLLLPVGKTTYHVLFAQKLKDCIGACDDDMKALALGRNQDLEEMLMTLSHEWLHAIESEYRIRIGHKKIGGIEADLAALIMAFVAP